MDEDEELDSKPTIIKNRNVFVTGSPFVMEYIQMSGLAPILWSAI